jgi:hypothetical protein
MLSRHDFGEFFSDLASKNFELLASLASVLKILLPSLDYEQEHNFSGRNIIGNPA